MTLRTTLAAALLGAAVSSAATPPPAPIEDILKVGREGAGNPAAAAAWRELAGRGPDAIPEILGYFPADRPAAANWLRTAVEAIAGKAAAAGKPLPAAGLEAFVRDRRRVPAARRLAYELLVRADPKAPERLLPGMLDDPSAELRRDAVARALAAAGETKDELRKLFALARDRDQVDDIAARLKKLGDEPDLAAHYGFVTGWWLVGPFDNVSNVGFAKAYPPEEKADLAALPVGKDGKTPLAWTSHTTPDPLGQVDLNKAVGKHMGAVAYAFAAVESPEKMAVQFRAGSGNAIKMFLNGKQVFASPVYHNGAQMDQYTASVTLEKGRNEVLLKVCQNEQTEVWAQDWAFRFRVCDAIGGAVPVSFVPPTLDGKPVGKGD